MLSLRYKPANSATTFEERRKQSIQGSVAEWSKALVLGTSPKGRGFESHRCHTFFFFQSVHKNYVDTPRIGTKIF